MFLLLSVSLLSILSFHPTDAFVAIHRPTTTTAFVSLKSTRPSRPASLALSASIQVTTPSPDDAADMGIRDWPQTQRNGAWQEQVTDGQTLVRYVLDGQGKLTITDNSSSSSSTTQAVGPGTLIEVTDDATLDWSGDLLLLTPGYEQGGLFLGVLATLLVVSVAAVTMAGGN